MEIKFDIIINYIKKKGTKDRQVDCYIKKYGL